MPVEATIKLVPSNYLDIGVQLCWKGLVVAFIRVVGYERDRTYWNESLFDS